jgi:hypothetical protein
LPLGRYNYEDMNNDQFDDLKQFIDGRLSQSEVLFDEKLQSLKHELKGEIGELRQEMTELRQEMHDGFAGVAEVIDDNNQHIDERLTKLEQAA